VDENTLSTPDQPAREDLSGPLRRAIEQIRHVPVPQEAMDRALANVRRVLSSQRYLEILGTLAACGDRDTPRPRPQGAAALSPLEVCLCRLHELAPLSAEQEKELAGLFGQLDAIRHAVQLLDRTDKQGAAVLRLIFGLEGEAPKTSQEIGACLGLTEEQVRDTLRAASDALLKGYLHPLGLAGRRPPENRVSSGN
jgi:hypothetical protein